MEIFTYPCLNTRCLHTLDRKDTYCASCERARKTSGIFPSESLAIKYPNYYKSVVHLDAIDVYAVHSLFNIQDPSGALQHASKKILLSGVRTGGKSVVNDIKEARDTLTRWLELNS